MDQFPVALPRWSSRRGCRARAQVAGRPMGVVSVFGGFWVHFLIRKVPGKTQDTRSGQRETGAGLTGRLPAPWDFERERMERIGMSFFKLFPPAPDSFALLVPIVGLHHKESGCGCCLFSVASGRRPCACSSCWSCCRWSGLPIVATGYVLRLRGLQAIVAEKRVHLQGVDALLAQHLQDQGGYRGLLAGCPAAWTGTEDPLPQQPPARLHRPGGAQAFPGIGVGLLRPGPGRHHHLRRPAASTARRSA